MDAHSTRTRAVCSPLIPTYNVTMASHVPSIAASFNCDGRLYLIRGSTHKVSSFEHKEFACGFCGQNQAATDRYVILKGESIDGARVTFIFCNACVQSAAAEFPNLEMPAVDRAIAKKIERDGAKAGSVIGMSEDELKPFLGKRVLVLLTSDNLWPTEANPDGRIVLTGVLQRNPLLFTGAPKYEVVTDDNTHQLIEDLMGIERIDEAIA
jgi:hypothetical protein